MSWGGVAEEDARLFLASNRFFKVGEFIKLGETDQMQGSAHS